MRIERTNRSGAAARTLTRAGASALGIGVIAVLALAGCAQADTAGSQTGGSVSTSSPEESDMTSPSPSASDGSEDGKLPDAADMELAAGNSGRGLPPGLEGSTDSTVGVAWSPEPGLLYVVTNGSSSCPTFAEPQATIGSGGKSAGVAAADGVLTVAFVPAEDGICTMDFVPTTTVVEVPAESDTGQPVPVQLGDKGKVELQPRSADGEPGPVAWLDS
ncbi:hypothetical protein ACH47X_15920 [Promicromonospora kroppenstedtii]|uniref:Uncharacterized protein n=1 Tax=Promicromonospora kroppenstedtii TaxID=440482 RepID=A0ABW7XLL3_9MICO